MVNFKLVQQWTLMFLLFSAQTIPQCPLNNKAVCQDGDTASSTPHMKVALIYMF